MNVGERVEKLLVGLGLSQDELARLISASGTCEVSKSWVYATIKRGDVRPHRAVLARMAELEQDVRRKQGQAPAADLEQRLQRIEKLLDTISARAQDGAPAKAGGDLRRLGRRLKQIETRMESLESAAGLRAARLGEGIEELPMTNLQELEGGAESKLARALLELDQLRAQINQLQQERAYREGVTPKGTKRIKRPLMPRKMFGGGGSL